MLRKNALLMPKQADVVLQLSLLESSFSKHHDEAIALARHALTLAPFSTTAATTLARVAAAAGNSHVTLLALAALRPSSAASDTKLVKAVFPAGLPDYEAVTQPREPPFDIDTAQTSVLAPELAALPAVGCAAVQGVLLHHEMLCSAPHLCTHDCNSPTPCCSQRTLNQAGLSSKRSCHPLWRESCSARWGVCAGTGVVTGSMPTSVLGQPGHLQSLCCEALLQLCDRHSFAAVAAHLDIFRRHRPGPETSDTCIKQHLAPPGSSSKPSADCAGPPSCDSAPHCVDETVPPDLWQATFGNGQRQRHALASGEPSRSMSRINSEACIAADLTDLPTGLREASVGHWKHAGAEGPVAEVQAGHGHAGTSACAAAAHAASREAATVPGSACSCCSFCGWDEQRRQPARHQRAECKHSTATRCSVIPAQSSARGSACEREHSAECQHSKWDAADAHGCALHARHQHPASQAVAEAGPLREHQHPQTPPLAVAEFLAMLEAHDAGEAEGTLRHLARLQVAAQERSSGLQPQHAGHAQHPEAHAVPVSSSDTAPEPPDAPSTHAPHRASSAKARPQAESSTAATHDQEEPAISVAARLCRADVAHKQADRLLQHAQKHGEAPGNRARVVVRVVACLHGADFRIVCRLHTATCCTRAMCTSSSLHFLQGCAHDEGEHCGAGCCAAVRRCAAAAIRPCAQQCCHPAAASARRLAAGSGTCAAAAISQWVQRCCCSRGGVAAAHCRWHPAYSRDRHSQEARSMLAHCCEFELVQACVSHFVECLHLLPCVTAVCKQSRSS